MANDTVDSELHHLSIWCIKSVDLDFEPFFGWGVSSSGSGEERLDPTAHQVAILFNLYLAAQGDLTTNVGGVPNTEGRSGVAFPSMVFGSVGSGSDSNEIVNNQVGHNCLNWLPSFCDPRDHGMGC